MWGVQIVATEFSDDFTQLQLITSHAVGEKDQKHHFGGQKSPLRGLWECQHVMKTSKKMEPTQITISRSFKLLFDLSDYCEVFKGSKRTVLGQIRSRWAPMESPNYLEVCEKVL